MAWRHYFICLKCFKHLTYITENEMPVSPGRTHQQAIENGAVQFGKDNSIPESCSGFGEIIYCSGYNVKHNINCAPSHKGTEELVPYAPASAPPEWGDFCTRVENGWQTFVNGNYAPALRGVNNNREYRTPPAVKNILQSSGGTVKIGNATYSISNSLTAGVSLHRTIPQNHQVGNMKSFIFHL